MQKTKLTEKFKRFRFILIVAAVILIAAGIGFFKFAGQVINATDGHPIYVVKKGPLRISVAEAGTIKAREQEILKNEVEGRTTILTIVPEGSKVKKGDLLVELDSSSLLDERIDLQIRVDNAEASYITANENLAVSENQAKSDTEKAQLTLDFAKLDLQKYIDGEYPNMLKDAQAKITLAEEELKRAEETLKWSEKLAVEKYLSQTELQADQLSMHKKNIDLELAKNNLNLLENFTHQREMAKLKSDVNQADMLLERTKRKANADVAQAKATLQAKKSEFEREKDKLKKNDDQIKKTKVYSPVDGQVVYATSAKSGGYHHSEEPLKEGIEVRERQELIYLPTASLVKAEIMVHESSLEKVKLGLPVRITVDALLGRVFMGKVAWMAPLPNAESSWLNPDLKIYDTDIYLEGDCNELRTGMSCKAEIIVAEYEDAIYVPVQAVMRVGGQETVYVANGEKFIPRTVEIGLDDNKMVHIVKGLKPDEEVWLTPPLADGAVEPFKKTEVGKSPTPVKTSTSSLVPIAKADEVRTVAEVNQPKAADKQARELRPNRDANLPPSAPQENLTPEQRAERRKKFENMSPEEREKMRSQRTRRQTQTQTQENK